MVGVNRFVEDDQWGTAIHRHAEQFEEEQTSALRTLRAGRDDGRVAKALEELGDAAASEANLMPVLIETVKAYATIGDICDVLRRVFGEHRAAHIY